MRHPSMAFFHHTNFDPEIKCIPTCLKSGEEPKYGSVLAGQHLFERFTSAVNQAVGDCFAVQLLTKD